MSQTDSNSPRFDRTSAAILDAAARVFADEGASANLATVATAAGVSRATLYRYYKSREVLLQALVRDAIDEAARRLADAGLERAPVETRSSASCVRLSLLATVTPCSSATFPGTRRPTKASSRPPSEPC